MEYQPEQWLPLHGLQDFAGWNSIPPMSSEFPSSFPPDIPSHFPSTFPPTTGSPSGSEGESSDSGVTPGPTTTGYPWFPSGSGSGSPPWSTDPPDDDWYPTTAGPNATRDPNIFSSYATEATKNAAAVGAIVGIVIAIVAVIVIFVLLCCFRERIMSKVCPEKSLVSDESGCDEEEFEVASADVRSFGGESLNNVTRRAANTGFGGGPRSLVLSDGTSAIDTVSVERFRNDYTSIGSSRSYNA